MRRAFICPSKYVQGENELLNLGYFVRQYGTSALLVATKSSVKRVREALDATAVKFGITFVETDFQGECSRDEIARLGELARKHSCHCTVGLGGGKALDTARCVAAGQGLIVVPTTAATDAPTSHSAVIYKPNGEMEDYAYFPRNPDVVLMDVSIIAASPVRYLVSGMGDALSTYFEARATRRSCSAVNAGLPCGARTGDCPPARGTLAAQALASTCYRTLLEDGYKAVLACQAKMATPALENIIEANSLLSGLGFESGGLAAAHAIHDGLTALDETHAYLHGEKVAFGTLAQLVLENAPTEELEELLEFCTSVGLPVCLKDIGVADISAEDLRKVARKACLPDESIYAMPFPITEDSVAAAILSADALGNAYRS